MSRRLGTAPGAADVAPPLLAATAEKSMVTSSMLSGLRAGLWVDDRGWAEDEAEDGSGGGGGGILQ